MTITRVQTFTAANKSNGTGSTVTNTLTSVPTAGNLLVAFLANGDSGGDITVSSFDDNIGDGVGWTAMTVNPVPLGASSSSRHRGYYKVVGTPSGGSKAVQCTITGTQALALFVAEYGVASGSPTWTVDGSQISANVSSAGPGNAGNITTTGTDNVLIGFSGTDGAVFIAGTSYTRQATSTVWASYAAEDRLVTSTGTYAVDWTDGGGGTANWAAIGISFNAATGSSATISTITGTTVTEASSVVFTTTMSGTGGGTFAYSWSGTATSADYTTTLTTGMCAVTGGSGSVTVSGSNITVDSTVTEFTVTVPTTTDTLDEANETIRLVIGGVTSSSGTINDDDAAPTLTGDTSKTVTAGDPVVITYSPGLSGQTRTYTLALTDGTATGGTDYDNTTVTGDFAVTAGTGSVSISGSTVTVDPGVTEFTLTIQTIA